MSAQTPKASGNPMNAMTNRMLAGSINLRSVKRCNLAGELNSGDWSANSIELRMSMTGADA
jgi:hypothetical protein